MYEYYIIQLRRKKNIIYQNAMVHTKFILKDNYILYMYHDKCIIYMTDDVLLYSIE